MSRALRPQTTLDVLAQPLPPAVSGQRPIYHVTSRPWKNCRKLQVSPPNKRRRRIVNMPLTAAAEAIIDKAPLSRRLILKPMRADAWDPARLSREVREYATEFAIRSQLRFNDLRGSKKKVTEMVWSEIGVPDLAIRIGWKIETAAKMLGVYAALKSGPRHGGRAFPRR